MRWGRLWRYATALGISRTSNPAPSVCRTRSSRRARFCRGGTVVSPTSLPGSRELRVLDVQAGGVEAPAGALGDQVGGVAEPLERRLGHVPEELGGHQRVLGDEAREAVAIEPVEKRVRVGLARGRAVA